MSLSNSRVPFQSSRASGPGLRAQASGSAAKWSYCLSASVSRAAVWATSTASPQDLGEWIRAHLHPTPVQLS